MIINGSSGAFGIHRRLIPHQPQVLRCILQCNTHLPRDLGYRPRPMLQTAEYFHASPMREDAEKLTQPFASLIVMT